MLKPILSLFLFIGLFLQTMAQTDCIGSRYFSPVFSDFMLTSDIKYGSNIALSSLPEDLLLDIYEPMGDSLSERPLVIVAHGGSFLFGNKAGPDVVPLCQDLAKRGYVVASIRYRLGIENIITGPDSSDGTEAVIRGTHDGHAAVRFFRKDVTENGNTYGVDTSRLYFGGASAGAFIALHVAFLDKASEFPDYIDTTKASLSGGLYGNSGNQGYSSDVDGVFSIAGAIGKTSWIDGEPIPVVSLHGDADGTVPYSTDLILVLGNPMLEVSGSFSIHQRLDELNFPNCFKPHPGADHVPHVSDVNYYDTTLTYVSNFLYSQTCDQKFALCNEDFVLGLSYPVLAIKEFDVFPNPATNEINLRHARDEKLISQIVISDFTGRTIRAFKNINDFRFTLSRAGMANGLYMISITSGSETQVEKVILE